MNALLSPHPHLHGASRTQDHVPTGICGRWSGTRRGRGSSEVQRVVSRVIHDDE